MRPHERLRQLEERELCRAIVAFRGVWDRREAVHESEQTWAMLARDGFHERTLESIERWVASRPPRARGIVDGLEEVAATTQPPAHLPRVRAALVALAPHLELTATTPAHRVLRTLTAALAGCPL